MSGQNSDSSLAPGRSLAIGDRSKPTVAGGRTNRSAGAIPRSVLVTKNQMKPRVRHGRFLHVPTKPGDHVFFFSAAKAKIEGRKCLDAGGDPATKHPEHKGLKGSVFRSMIHSQCPTPVPEKQPTDIDLEDEHFLLWVGATCLFWGKVSNESSWINLWW